MNYRINNGDIVVLPIPYGRRDYVIGVAQADYNPKNMVDLEIMVDGELQKYSAPEAIRVIDFLHSRDQQTAELKNQIGLLSNILGMAGTRVVTEAEAKKLGIESKL